MWPVSGLEMGEGMEGQLSQWPSFSHTCSPWPHGCTERPQLPAKLTAKPPTFPPSNLRTALDPSQDDKLRVQMKKLSSGLFRNSFLKAVRPTLRLGPAGSKRG